MKKLGVFLLLAMAFPLVAWKGKHKEKTFEPVAVTAAQAAGRYVGIDPDFVIELTADSGGMLRNFADRATLTNLVFDGSEMTATALYGGTRRENLQVTFVNRIKNGERAFGLMIRNMDVRIDNEVTIQNLFCRRE